MDIIHMSYRPETNNHYLLLDAKGTSKPIAIPHNSGRDQGISIATRVSSSDAGKFTLSVSLSSESKIINKTANWYFPRVRFIANQIFFITQPMNYIRINNVSNDAYILEILT